MGNWIEELNNLYASGSLDKMTEKREMDEEEIKEALCGNGECQDPIAAGARVQCSLMLNPEVKVVVVPVAPIENKTNGGIGLRDIDTRFLPPSFGFCKETQRTCQPMIGTWQSCSNNGINNRWGVAMNSYILCSNGGNITLVTDGQTVGSEGKKEYVTLEQLTHESLEKKWCVKEVLGYDMTTSLPVYGEIREMTQEDIDRINKVLDDYEINTPNRIAHFLAQCSVECEAGKIPVERYNGDNIFEYFRKYEGDTDVAKSLGNTKKGDGAKYRGAGAIQITGREVYESFSEYMNDPKIVEEGALYVAKEYFWESAGYYWSIYKPKTANDDRFDLNKKCDNNESVEDITFIINVEGLGLYDRKMSYESYRKLIN